LAVGSKRSPDSGVLTIPNDNRLNLWSQMCSALGGRLEAFEDKLRGVWRARAWLDAWKNPYRVVHRRLGIEDFNYPGTYELLTLPPLRPDILHCHNLHRDYFDLRALPWLSRQVPVILTLHDPWLLSGHCAYSFDCERWKTGCGTCPDLTIYPAIRRDATAFNWRRKQEVYTKSRLFVATPSRWLMDRVHESMLAPAIIEARVIPNAIDLSTFHACDKGGARATLGIPQDAKVLLFTANGIRRNIRKDYQTMRTAFAQVAERMQGQSLLFIALGEDAPMERIGRAEVHFVPYQKDPEAVARYCQAADVYIHAARVEVWGLTITEALACGTPVVATAVGGIPEQVKGLEASDCRLRSVDLNAYGIQEATGILVPPGDSQEMAKGIERLLSDDSLRLHMGENAAKDARKRFDLNRQVDEYLTWYEELLRGALDHPARLDVHHRTH